MRLIDNNPWRHFTHENWVFTEYQRGKRRLFYYSVMQGCKSKTLIKPLFKKNYARPFVWQSLLSTEFENMMQFFLSVKSASNNEIIHVISSGKWTIDYFRDVPTDSQTTDITHFAFVFHYDITIKALETLWSTANITYDVIMKNAKYVMSVVWRVKSRFWTVMSRELENGLFKSVYHAACAAVWRATQSSSNL